MVVAENPIPVEEQLAEEEKGDQDTITKAEPIFSLQILKIIHECQQQHGLRHSDYQRYRGYCTRRIQRLRQTLHFPQGDKRHFKRRDVTVNHLKDERFLHIPLMLSERAWGYAMQLRQEANTEPRKKFHLVAKLRKAVKYAEQLATLCQSDLCDARTKLEAQAYIAWMKGSMTFEIHAWKEALDYFQQAQVVYEKLCGVVKETDLPIYKHKCEELVPNLRYCAYSIGDSSAISDLKDLRGKAHGDILDKLDRLLVEARAKDGSGVAEVDWRGHMISVRPPEVGAFLLTDQELKIDLPGSQADVDELERHVIHCKDAISAVRDLLASEGAKLKPENHPLQMLLSYLTYIRLTRSNERARLMIDLAKNEKETTIDQEAGFENSDNQSDFKKGKPAELIRHYEIILQNLTEMQQLSGLENDTEFQNGLEATINAYKAYRCYYIGEVLTSAKKLCDALALYDRGLYYISETDHNKVDTIIRGDLDSLSEKIKLARCVCIAKAVLQNEDNKGETSTAEGQPTDSQDLSKVPLIDRLDVYYEDPNILNKKANLITIPPEMELIQCKPLFFDIAQNYIKFPNLELEKRTAENQEQSGQGITGFVKGLWGWGGSKK